LTDDEIRALIAEKAKVLEKRDHFALLGVGPDASKSDIAKAYVELAKVLHPDRLNKRGLKDVLAEAAPVFAALSEAQSVLTDPKRREDYQRQHPMAGATTEEIQARVASQSTQELMRQGAGDLGIPPKEAAKIFFHKGMTLMKKGAFGEAEAMLQKALDGDEENFRYSLQLGWAIFQNTSRPDGKRLAQARVYLEKAVAGDPDNPEGQYYMARLWRESGDNEKCRQHLEKAIAKRPNFIEAKRELRLLEMRGLTANKAGETKSAASASGPATRGSSTRTPAAAEKADTGSRWPFGLDRFFKKK
jgi:curved DNA-binding protein CbpA